MSLLPQQSHSCTSNQLAALITAGDLAALRLLRLTVFQDSSGPRPDAVTTVTIPAATQVSCLHGNRCFATFTLQRSCCRCGGGRGEAGTRAVPGVGLGWG